MRPLFIALLSMACAASARAACTEAAIKNYDQACIQDPPEGVVWNMDACVKAWNAVHDPCTEAIQTAMDGMDNAKTGPDVERWRTRLVALKDLLQDYEIDSKLHNHDKTDREAQFGLFSPLTESNIKKMTENATTRIVRQKALKVSQANGNENERRGPETTSPTDGLPPVTKLIVDAPPTPGPTEDLGRIEDSLFKGGALDDKTAAGLGKQYLDQKTPAAAERVLERSVSQGGGRDVQTQSLLAAARLGLGKLDAAREAAQAALKQDPENKLARQVQAYVNSAGHTGRFDKPQFGALAKGQENHGGQAGAGGGGAQDPAPANQAPAMPGLTMVRPEGPGGALRASAERRASLGDLSGALLDASRAIEADRLDPRSWAERAEISNRLENYEGAIADAGEALRLDSRNVQALLERAYALLQTGKFDEALADVNKALELAPNRGLAYLYRAMIFEKLGSAAEALKDYETAARLDPALRPLADAGRKRLGGKAEPKGAGRSPLKPVLWVIAIITAAGLLLEGIKRVFKPGWVTAPPPQPSQPSTGTLAPGSLLDGNFRIERELARGGMGVVYEATDMTLKRSVAIKQLRRDSYESEEIRERFLREAQLAAKLRHPHLAQIYSVVGQQELHLVFEFVEGETLDSLLKRRGKLSVEETLPIVRQVASALDYAHAQKVIHRDLKPANVMVSQDGGCKVMDFGIAHEARTMSGSTQTAAWGTPPYMAPEQEMGTVSRLSDLYSLGVLAYELVTGRRPFQNPPFLDSKLNRRYPAPSESGLPLGIDDFFSRALDPDPAKRFNSAAEFLAALETAGRRPVGA